MITNEWYMGKQNAQTAMEIRKKVLVDELKLSPFSQFDSSDDQAMHLVVSINEVPAATGRVYYDFENKTFTVDKYCVLKEFRGQGIGELTFKLLLYKVFEYCEKAEIVVLPKYEEYYSRYGFVKKSDELGEGHTPLVRLILEKENLVYPSKCKGHK